MSTHGFSILFIAFLLATLVVRCWLLWRHVRHVHAHRGAVPSQFAEKIPLAAHQKAADYTVARSRFSLLTMFVNVVVLLGFTLLGGLQWLSVAVVNITGPGMTYQIALLAAFAAISGIIDLPFEYYRQFVLEAKFGFNKMTPKLFISDMLKSVTLGAAIGLPLVWVILALMDRAGDLWWLYAWFVWSGFQLLMMVLFPTVIAPLFNKFTPLADAALKSR